MPPSGKIYESEAEALWQFTQLPRSPKSDKKEFNMTAVKNHIKIVGYGTHLPRNTVTFKDQTRYRVVGK